MAHMNEGTQRKQLVLQVMAIVFGILVFGQPEVFGQNGTWSTKAPMPTARHGLGIGVVNGTIYALGGTTSNSSFGSDFSTVEAYNPVNNTWSTVAPMPTPRHTFAVGVINGVLYAAGGYSFNTCNCAITTLEAYDPVSNTWSTKAPMNIPRAAPAGAVVNGLFYAISGDANGTVEAYDPVQNTWSMKASLPTSLNSISPAAAVVDGLIYVVGGAGNSGPLSSTYVYDPFGNTWSTKASMPTARYLLGAGTINEILYAVGGSPPPGVGIGTPANEAYDPTTDSWTVVASMPTSRDPGVGAVNGVLYAIGGFDFNANVPLSTNEAFTQTPPGVALLTGGNTFSGNQNVIGNVTASFYFGDGSNLTNVNASNLGGVAAANYARLDVGNSFSGTQNVAGNVSSTGNLSVAGTATLGSGGTPIVQHLSATFNPSFAAIKPSTCVNANFTLTGASDGDALALGVPNARTTGGGTIVYFAWVSAANTVTIQGCNLSTSPQKTAGSGAIRVDVWKH